jgi:cytochrome c553
MSFHRILWGAALLALGAAAAQSAEPAASRIVREGNGKGAPACVTCHGQDGGGMSASGFPRLAGQNAEYLAKQLRDMQKGLRSNPTMQPVAKALSEEEILAMTKYYAALPIPAVKEPAFSASLLQQGEQLAKYGKWSQGVPACFQCHANQGQGVGTHFPAIAGQSSVYLANQLRDWKNGSRRNDPQELMKTVASHLTPEEAKVVAAYLASLGRH